MKGILEILFPSLDGEKESSECSKEDRSQRRLSWRGLSSLKSGIAGYLNVPPIEDYFKVLEYESQLRFKNREWRSFTPTRACARVHKSWLSNEQVAKKFFANFEDFVSENPLHTDCPLEIVVPDERVSVIEDLDSVVTLSGLEDEASVESLRANQAGIEKLHNRYSLGLEFQGGRSSGEREFLRKKIQLASVVRPKFIRILHEAGEGSSFFRLALKDEMNKESARGLQLAIEAFETLGYEPVALYPHALVLSLCDSVERAQLRIPQRLLGLGMGAKSYRTDRVGRMVTSSNEASLDSYSTRIRQQWKYKELVALSHAAPYLHAAIEQAFVDGEGLCYEAIKQEFGVDLEKVHPGLLGVLSEAGLTQKAGGKVYVAPRAQKHMREVMWNFFLQNDVLEAA